MNPSDFAPAGAATPKRDNSARKNESKSDDFSNQSSLCDEGTRQERHQVLFAETTTDTSRVLRYQNVDGNLKSIDSVIIIASTIVSRHDPLRRRAGTL